MKLKLSMPIVHIVPQLTHDEYVEVVFWWSEYMNCNHDDVSQRNELFKRYAIARDAGSKTPITAQSFRPQLTGEQRYVS